ncbi:unnamed protein product [Vicia faba]|uniref:Flavonol synthase n=1 Tax=Vicia faba TaxID=3906 RepID=A0AAV0ZL33_VICFA|nr:unnamed protein product [Vicia faba]
MEVMRVQTLAINQLRELPPQFIRSDNERPENTKALDGVNVPIISLSQPHHILVAKITEAASDWGFFVIIDHGISSKLIQNLQDVGQKFFYLPQKEKEVYANDPSIGMFEGYGTKMTKNLEEKIEWLDYYFHLMSPPSRVNYEMWPKNPSSYREVTEEYNKEILRVTNNILERLSEGLALESNALKSCLGGLQVWKENNWVAVNYLQNALFVHIGDQLEVLSNGKYKSVLHRSLVNKERKRMSWAAFVSPPQEVMVGPLPMLVNDQNPPKYSTKAYAEYRYRKFNKIPQ